jgi:hypothetical protein
VKAQKVRTAFAVVLLLTILFLSYLSIAQGFKNGPPKPTETVTVVCYMPSIDSMNESVTISTHSPARIIIDLGTYGTQDVALVVGRNGSTPDNPSQVQITDDLPPYVKVTYPTGRYLHLQSLTPTRLHVPVIVSISNGAPKVFKLDFHVVNVPHPGETYCEGYFTVTFTVTG